jgi:hypothetical protein
MSWTLWLGQCPKFQALSQLNRPLRQGPAIELLEKGNGVDPQPFVAASVGQSLAIRSWTGRHGLEVMQRLAFLAVSAC